MDDLCSHIRETIEAKAGKFAPVDLNAQFPDPHATTIRQSVHIDSPGIYVLSADVVFDAPEDIEGYLLRPRKDALEAMGQLGGIHIETDGVVLDLNGYAIRMTPRFYAMQRYFNLIALNAHPFSPEERPTRDAAGDPAGDAAGDAAGNAAGDAEDADAPGAKYILIRNGKLGLTSNAAIHGRNVECVHIEGVDISSFERSGIHLQSARYCVMGSLRIHDALQCSPLNGLTSLLCHFYRQNKSIPEETRAKLVAFFNDVYQVDNIEDLLNLDPVTYASFLNASRFTSDNVYGLRIDSKPPHVNWKLYVDAVQFDNLSKNTKYSAICQRNLLNLPFQHLHKEYLEFDEMEELLEACKSQPEALALNNGDLERLDPKLATLLEVELGCAYIEGAYKCSLKNVHTALVKADFGIRMARCVGSRLTNLVFERSRMGLCAIHLAGSEKSTITNLTLDERAASAPMHADGSSEISVDGLFVWPLEEAEMGHQSA